MATASAFSISQEGRGGGGRSLGPTRRAESENTTAAINVVVNGGKKNNNNKSLARWPLAKYANLIVNGGKTAEGTWKERTAQQQQQQRSDMWIQITKQNYVQVVHGEYLLECCALSDIREWRSVRRGPCMLFHTSNGEKKGRQFRIRFLDDPEEGRDAAATALHCLQRLSRHMLIHDADNPDDAQHKDPPQQQCIQLSQLAEAIINPQRSKWPTSYTCGSKAAVSEEISPDLLRSCLMDPNFPAVVEAVEKALKKLMTSDEA